MKLVTLVLVVLGGCTDQNNPVDDPASTQTTDSGDTIVIGGGAIDTSNAFFQSLGTNGRSCASCHEAATGWTVTPASLAARPATDPVFAGIDGADAPGGDSHALLLSRGVFRIGLPVPANADFTVTVDDPYGYASPAELSLYRRPRPSTNLGFAVQLMWDGREPDLAHQATDATMGHAQATTADPTTMAAIAAFEKQLITARSEDSLAGALPGPAALETQPFSPGINDAFGGSFDRDAFTTFVAWEGSSDARKAAIARGERIFNTEPIRINNVPGIPNGTRGSCSTCHDTPNVGNHSVPLLINLGVATAARRTSDVPLYTLRSTSGQTIQLSDPGAALITGKFADAGKFVVPELRGLAVRAPYFHDGSAATLGTVVKFYNDTFDMHLSGQEQADLVAFLGAL
jgi:cytochrome c peroxidase